jgi:hypothetical protein
VLPVLEPESVDERRRHNRLDYAVAQARGALEKARALAMIAG